MRAIRRFTIRAALPEPLAPLRELMLNLRWSWHAPTRDLFAALDPAGRPEVGRDPFTLLGEIPQEHLDRLATDQDYLRRVNAAAADLRDYLSAPRWYQLSAGRSAAGPAQGSPPADPGQGSLPPDPGQGSLPPDPGQGSLPPDPGTGAMTGEPAAGSPPAAVAYFSPEYGIDASLPQYSGGLGILAGDHLKAASDLGVPLIGVGLLYSHGYFSQSLSPEGWQLERYPASDPNGLPLTLLRDGGSEPVRVSLTLAGGHVLTAHVWLARVGRVPLLLLDSSVEENEPSLREVTDRLYGGGSEHRLRQELLLGIGGVRAVRAFCGLTGHPRPEVFHTNEGHAGFLGLERIREYAAQGVGFDEAVELCRAGTVFTTHTPVPAGIDRFPRDLVERHFSDAAADEALPPDRVLALGAETYPGGDPGVFNMAVMGMRLAQRVNGVSRLHGEVSRAMFAGLWPGFDAAEVPISSITNGVHAATWVAPEVLRLAAGDEPQVGPDLPEDGQAWERVASSGPARLWEMRCLLRTRLVAQARQRLRASWRQRGVADAELDWTQEALGEDVLTIGFARRVPSYKRLTLMLRDPGRLRGLLTDPERPVQILIAGKAHPADEGGKHLIQQMVRFADDAGVRHRIAVLPDYDIALARALVQGCDVWLNNPLRPLEACGTSGMKAALNGGLNLSVADGWWAEWHDGRNGWEIPSAEGVTDPDHRDDLESAALYDLLEQVVAPLFYDRGADGLPHRWLEMIRHTLGVLGPRVQASRMVRCYVADLYLPAARASRLLDAGAGGPCGAGAAPEQAGRPQVGDAARDLAAWKRRVRKAWAGVRIEHVEAEDGDLEPGGGLGIRASVALGDLTTGDVSVEVVCGPVSEDDEITSPVTQPMSLDAPPGDSGIARYSGQAVLSHPGPFGYTVRVVPRHRLLASAAEMGLVAVPGTSPVMADGDLR